jgi:hypothetical protein
MDKKLENLFKNMQLTNPPKKLSGDILMHIEKIQKRRFQLKTVLSTIGSSISVLVAVYLFFILGSSIVNSEFWNVISLVFSDITIVVQNWQEFSLLLLETVPALTLALILIPIFTFLLSLNGLVKSGIFNKFNKYNYI